jgi:ABC-type multidrug transport system ATPase subunit
MSDVTIAIRTDRLRLSAKGRRVYPPVTLEVEAGSTVAIIGAAGTGKTALLLTLAGRMRHWHGTADMCGINAATHGARVRGLVGMGLMLGVNDLAEALTARQHVAEQHVFVPRSKRSATVDVLARVGLDAAADLQVKRLDAEQRARLGIALALVRDVRVLVVDDVDRDLNHEERLRVLGLLRDLADDGLTVLFACVDDATAANADQVISLEDECPMVREVSADAVA